MGIDYGLKRVGVAITDQSGSVAFPKAVLPNNASLMRDIVKMIADEGVSEVVVGESRQAMGDGDNPIAKNIRFFAEQLGREAPVTMHFEPEQYTSQEARAHTGEALVDARAAAIILNSFLTKRHGTHD